MADLTIREVPERENPMIKASILPGPLKTGGETTGNGCRDGTIVDNPFLLESPSILDSFGEKGGTIDEMNTTRAAM